MNTESNPSEMMTLTTLRTEMLKDLRSRDWNLKDAEQILFEDLVRLHGLLAGQHNHAGTAQAEVAMLPGDAPSTSPPNSAQVGREGKPEKW